jgi:hypothetical protein
MNWKRFFVAVLVAFVAATILDILLNAVMLRGAWIASAQCWRPPAEMNRLVGLGWASMLFVIVCQSAIFARARWQGLGRGLEFRSWLGIAAFVGVACGISSVVAWPMKLIMSMAIQQLINNLITGCSLGWLYRNPVVDLGSSSLM